MKTNRGGARPGAGRKPRDTPREAITVRIEPQDAAKLRDLCKARGVSQSGWVAEQINQGTTRPPIDYAPLTTEGSKQAFS